MYKTLKPHKYKHWENWVSFHSLPGVLVLSLRPNIAEWKHWRDCVAPLSSVGFCPRKGSLVCYSWNRIKALLWQIVIYVWTLFMQPGLIQWELSIPKGALFFYFNDASGSRLSVSSNKKTSVTLIHLFVYACLSTCRPPILSQVLPRAHSASQGSVVAVHRMQDLQQLSRSRKECGEWMSEYVGLAA